MEDDSIIAIVEYAYSVGDLVEFKFYNESKRSHEIGVGIVIKRYLQNHFWYKEAKKKIQERGKDFLILYDVAYKSKVYPTREKEIVKLVSQ